MSATINIVETTTELGIEVVEVTVTDASAPGPAGVGVPTGGTANQVLTKDSSTDYDTSWQDAQGAGGGAPDDVDYLVGTASGDLSAEIVVGTSPGGELGGTWASPTVDATHSGSSHAAVQAAAEATAAAALSGHASDTTGIHGISDTSALETAAGAQAKVDAHVNDATDAHAGTAIGNTPAGSIAATTVQAAINELDSEKAATASAVMDGDAAGGVLSGTYPNPGFASDMATQAELDAHVTDSSAAHAASAISADSTTLVGTGTDVQAVLEELDNGIADHLADTSAAHAASAISFTPEGSIAATDVQAAIQEVRDEAGGSVDVEDESLIVSMEVYA
jgi:hypothetical protein